MVATPHVLARLPTLGLRLYEELRPAEYVGPQRACHPDEVELCVLHDGVERFQQGRHHGLMGAGQYSLVAAGHEHSSWTTDAPVRETVLHLRLARLEALAASAGLRLTGDLPFGAFDVPPELAGALALLTRELAHGDAPPGHELLVDSLLIALWVPLLRRHAQPLASPPTTDPLAIERRLRRVEELLRAAPADPHTLDDLAQVAGLSRFHLLREFKRRYGLPPYAYLTRLRVDRAAALARDTDLPLTTIALDVGFGSSSRLTEAFRSRFGQNPAAWRRGEPPAISGKQRQQ